MIINSGSQAYLAALTRSTQRNEQSDSTSANQSASDQGSSSGSSQTGTPQTGAAPLSGLHVLSRIQTTLPDGRTLAVTRFDLGTNGLDTSADGSSPAAPSLEDQREDQQMLQAFMGLAHYLNDTPNASNTELEGTAAIDLKGDLKA